MIEYRLLKELQKNPTHTQRSLANRLNISLGRANYVLSGFVEKGVIKAKKLKDSPRKIRWQYILTPKGLKEKMRISKDYLKRRLEEFSEIQKEIEDLKLEVAQEAASEDR